MRRVQIYTVDIRTIKHQILAWAEKFNEIVWLDSNAYPQKHSTYEAVLAVDAFTSLKTDFHNAFQDLDEYQKTTHDWLFGYLSYDLKNDVEQLSSENFDGLHFPHLYFFQPKRLFLFTENEVEIQYLNLVEDELETDWQEILNFSTENFSEKELNTFNIQPRISKESYFEKVSEMLRHIERGDIYEANFCQEFYAENAAINPLKTYFQLNGISLPPFATFLKLHHLYALSASPERYLKKTGNHVISQPIKGTARRSPIPSEDEEIKNTLAKDPKERSENIMITDLVRNDLSRVAKKGSVNVEELCQVYSFRQVHQLISTIGCEVKVDISPVEIIKNSFPMGSMTGAPKISAMAIIEKLEETKRGLYSGAIGYFSPGGDFDFNVLIRSILYNSEKKYMSFSVGGAITAKSVLTQEYEECLLKARAMFSVL